MPARSPTESSLPAVISVTEMARRLGLSRSRFYELVSSGIFPMPVYCIFTRRPMYLTAQVVECLRVKQTNMGANGQYILFYAARQPVRPAGQTRISRGAASQSPQPSAHAEILDGLTVLGLTDATDQQVESALRVCFPDGWAGRDEGEVLRTVWTQIRRSNVG